MRTAVRAPKQIRNLIASLWSLRMSRMPADRKQTVAAAHQKMIPMFEMYPNMGLKFIEAAGSAVNMLKGIFEEKWTGINTKSNTAANV